MNVLDNQKKREAGTLLDNKILNQGELKGGLQVKTVRNSPSERIFVEFSSPDGKLVLQRNFQDNITGRKLADDFKNSLKSLDDLKRYFKIIK